MAKRGIIRDRIERTIAGRYQEGKLDKQSFGLFLIKTVNQSFTLITNSIVSEKGIVKNLLVIILGYTILDVHLRTSIGAAFKCHPLKAL